MQEIRPLTIHAPPGLYEIELGVFTPKEGRLPIITSDLLAAQERLLLVQVRVTD